MWLHRVSKFQALFIKRIFSPLFITFLLKVMQ